MPEKSSAEKMRLKAGMTAAVLHEPAGLLASLGFPPDVTLIPDPARAELRLRALEPHVAEKTLIWLAYPKGSKAAGYDVSRDTIFAAAASLGLTLVANIAVDRKWSAVRVRRA
jgi:hypothetical protein